METTSNFTGVSGVHFPSKGAETAPSTAKLGFGFDVFSHDQITVSVDYGLEMKDDFMAHTGILKGRYVFK